MPQSSDIKMQSAGPNSDYFNRGIAKHLTEINSLPHATLYIGPGQGGYNTCMSVFLTA